MATNPPPHLTTEMKISACIGNICLQWALLETSLLAVITVLEGMDRDKVFLMFGGLDMRPRFRVTIDLASQKGVPSQFAKRLRAVQKQLFDGLDEERHQAVHGVHAYLPDVPDKVQLTMTRWRGDKRTQDKTPQEMFQTAAKLHALANEVWKIFDDIGVWKYGQPSSAYIKGEVAQAAPASRFKLAQQFKHRFNHFWRWLRGT